MKTEKKLKRIKKRVPKRGTTFGGFVTQGDSSPPSFNTLSSSFTPSPPSGQTTKMKRSPSGSLRHKFLVRSSRSVYTKSSSAFYNKPTGLAKTAGQSSHLNKITRAEKSAKKSQKKKLTKLAKYGRTEVSLQHHHQRQYLKQQRESKWKIEDDEPKKIF
jgi:hypothetical protein